MTYLTTQIEKRKCFKGMNKGDKYYKCGLFAFNLKWGSEYELVGYAMVNDLKTAKKLFLKELEEDEEATINYYMVITPYEFVGKFINEKGQVKHAKKCGPTYINYFGQWKTKAQWFKECYDFDVDANI